MWIEKWKQENKMSVQKSKGLRKQLNKDYVSTFRHDVLISLNIRVAKRVKLVGPSLNDSSVVVDHILPYLNSFSLGGYL